VTWEADIDYHDQEQKDCAHDAEDVLKRFLPSELLEISQNEDSSDESGKSSPEMSSMANLESRRASADVRTLTTISLVSLGLVH